MYEVGLPLPEEAEAIEELLDKAFGPGRRNKTSYRYRDGVEQLAELSLVARDRGRIVGSIAYWPVTIGGDTPALLLGPLAIDPARQGGGLGRDLLARSLDSARRLGHRIVVLVGDPKYYGRAGFAPAAPYGITMPGEDPARLQIRELQGGALAGVSGPILPAEPPAACRRFA